MAQQIGRANGGGRRSFADSGVWCPPPSLTSPFGLRMRFKPVIVVPVGLSVAALSLTLLYQHVDTIVRNRLEYQSWIPWFIGVVLALTLGWRPMARSASWVARLIVRSLVLTLLLAPIPYGPEGTLVPALLAMIFPPLIMLFLCPVGPLLTFVALLGIVASFESVVSARRRFAEQSRYTEPGDDAAVSKRAPLVPGR